ncbi:MAG: heparinase II/III family protein [Hyphomicrobium sp.]
MTGLSLTERLKIRTLSAEQVRRRALTRTLSSPLLRWRYGSAAADQILIVPQELRAADPSFWFEIESDHFGLASEIADLKGASPFRIVPPSIAWERELNGFGWLRHLAAAEVDEAAAAARQYVLDWIKINRTPRGVAFEPAVTGRRLMSWIAHANMLLEGTDAKTYTSIMSSVGEQVVTLNATWRNAPDGVPRMISLIALVLSDLAVAGHDRQLKDAEAALIAELNRQILDDGGHVSRNPNVLADLVLDLLPLGQCFQARGRQAPEEIAEVVKKALAFLRFMRLGDGMLARFNGVSTGSPAGLATVLGYSGGELEAVGAADASGYARLERGETIVIVDIGSPPALEVATEAQAGALSFEMTSRARLVFVNGGFPGPADRDWNSVARATASHNTLCLAETSSSRLVRHAKLEDIVGGLPIRGPDMVAARLSDEGGMAVLAGSHDGYVQRFGLMHTRRIALTQTGERVEGLDRLEPPQGSLRLKADLPFAIHFHLHPDCRCERTNDRNSCRIRVQDGQVWIFTCDGANLTIEDGLYFVDSAGPRPNLQIVLRGATYGETEVRWHVKADPMPDTQYQDAPQLAPKV